MTLSSKFTELYYFWRKNMLKGANVGACMKKIQEGKSDRTERKSRLKNLKCNQSKYKKEK